jgi:hypothetical protein
MTPKNLAVEPDVMERIEQEAAAAGVSVDELATEALKRELARRWMERNKREAQVRRGSMTDDEVEALVDKTVHDWRAEQRGR